MQPESKLKKPLLYALIGSVLIGATLGIVLVLRDTWGWLEVRVILTTAVIAAASVCGLASDLCRTPRGRNLLPKAGLTLTALASLMLLLGIWVEIDSELFWKWTFCACTFCVATVHVCLLSIAKLATKFRWVYFIGSQIIFGFAAMLSLIVFGEIDLDEVWRYIAAISIVIAAISLVIPILHRISRMEGARGAMLSPLEVRNVDAIDQQIIELETQIAQLKTLRAKLLGDPVDGSAQPNPPTP